MATPNEKRAAPGSATRKTAATDAVGEHHATRVRHTCGAADLSSKIRELEADAQNRDDGRCF